MRASIQCQDKFDVHLENGAQQPPPCVSGWVLNTYRFELGFLPCHAFCHIQGELIVHEEVHTAAEIDARTGSPFHCFQPRLYIQCTIGRWLMIGNSDPIWQSKFIYKCLLAL